MTNNKEIAFLTLTAITLAAVGIVAQAVLQPPKESTPDWTVAPCAWWADTSTPTLPPFTYTDRCARPDGSISYAK